MRWLRGRRQKQIEEIADAVAERTVEDLRETFVDKVEHERAMREIDDRLERVQNVWAALRGDEEVPE